jgi:lipoic acid synthetase
VDHTHPVVLRKPAWLKVRLPTGEGYAATLKVARAQSLHTVCEDARCPNIAECWGRKTATFMILGDLCTRSCGFCAVKTGRPTGLDLDEPRRTALAVKELAIKHAVITTVWASRPDVFGHNVECVARLQRQVRSAANYERSLMVLEETCKQGLLAKTGLQVGHGETWEEILAVMDDLARLRLDILTIGQYLQPTREHLTVKRFYTPEEFARLRDEAKARGIRYVQSGPLVRSSYRAEEPFETPADRGGL